MTGEQSSTTLVVLQARTNSSRLPGKALLRLGGLESAILAALRAKNAGHRVVLATSNLASDDLLAHRAKIRGIEVFRGELEDVRSRFVDLSRNLPANHVLVRLTGDNTFPDGNIVQLAVTALRDTGAHIVRSMEDPRLPYGLAVEAFRVSALRDSLSDASIEAKEHVTPPLIQRQKVFEDFVPMQEDLSRLRCTLDTAEDFERLQFVFADQRDAVSTPWERLVERLVEHSVRSTKESQQ